MPDEPKKDTSYGWFWKYSKENDCMELFDDEQMLAFIIFRPAYCDRGHYQVGIEIGGLNLDYADGRELMHYMELDVAMAETAKFLRWRMFKVRGENLPHLEEKMLSARPAFPS